MKTMTLQELLEETTCILLGSTTTDDSIIHSVGLTIKVVVPKLKLSEIHVHLDLVRTTNGHIVVKNMTLRQMSGYKFWRWLESSTPDDFFTEYIVSLFEQSQRQSVKKILN